MANKANVGARKLATQRPNSAAPGAWVRQHLASLNDTVRHFRFNFSSYLLSALVIGITLALPLGLQVLQDNFQRLTEGLGGVPEASLFLRNGQTLAMVAGIAEQLRNDHRVRGVRVIDKDDALAALSEDTQLGVIVGQLADNPLPHTIIVGLHPNYITDMKQADFRSHLENIDGVAEVQMDASWIERLEQISSFVALTAAVCASIIGLGVVLITGNTIRTGIHQRRDEIEVAKLFGATDAYVRRPFLYSGALQGVFGALLACFIVMIAVELLRADAAQLATLYDSAWRMSNLGIGTFLLTLIAGLLLGWLGAVVAVSLNLRRLDISA